MCLRFEPGGRVSSPRLPSTPLPDSLETCTDGGDAIEPVVKVLPIVVLYHLPVDLAFLVEPNGFLELALLLPPSIPPQPVVVWRPLLSWLRVVSRRAPLSVK